MHSENDMAEKMMSNRDVLFCLILIRNQAYFEYDAILVDITKMFDRLQIWSDFFLKFGGS